MIIVYRDHDRIVKRTKRLDPMPHESPIRVKTAARSAGREIRPLAAALPRRFHARLADDRRGCLPPAQAEMQRQHGALTETDERQCVISERVFRKLGVEKSV